MANPIQYSFQRYELKYLLTPEQYAALLPLLEPWVVPDTYGRYSISSIYYDTPDWRLIRASIEKPSYKEKLRVRSYGVPGPGGTVFVELKKKVSGIVYKRRIAAAAELAGPFLQGGDLPGGDGQIAREIRWFQQVWQTEPRVFIGYDRLAFAGAEDSQVRITFDTNIRWHTTGLDLRLGDSGAPLITTGEILMEVKVPGACPLWLCRALTEVRAAPTSFSKYGACYRRFLLPNFQRNEALFHA